MAIFLDKVWVINIRLGQLSRSIIKINLTQPMIPRKLFLSWLAHSNSRNQKLSTFHEIGKAIKLVLWPFILEAYICLRVIISKKTGKKAKFYYVSKMKRKNSFTENIMAATIAEVNTISWISPLIFLEFKNKNLALFQ